MLSGAAGSTRQSSLLSAYSALLAQAMLRDRVAEDAAKAEAQLANKLKSEFMASMGQELKSPLNTVIGLANLLGEHQRRHLQDGEIVAYGERIRDAATHLLCLINDILDISRMHDHAFTLDTRKVALDQILQVALASLRPTAFEGGVALGGDFDKDLPSVEADPGKLRKVFANLIGNAVRFTPRGGAVMVEGRTLHDGGVAVHVRDNGHGMTREEIAAAMAPFPRSGHARWREGSGLGLPIAQALVQLHGGRLQIQSSEAQGTEVTVILPARPPASDRHEYGGGDRRCAR